MRWLLLVCGSTLILASSALPAPPATPTVTSSVAPVVLDAGFYWSGCGYQPGQEIRLQTSGITTTGEYEFADASGCFVSSTWVIGSVSYPPGSETAGVYKVSPTIGKSQKMLATVTVMVVAAA